MYVWYTALIYLFSGETMYAPSELLSMGQLTTNDYEFDNDDDDEYYFYIVF